MTARVDQRPQDAPAATDLVAGVLESVDYPVVVLDRAGCATYVNRACERLVSRDRSAILGKGPAEALPEIFGDAFDFYSRTSGLGSPAQFEHYHAPLDLWTDVRAYPAPMGILVCAHDITARKVTERVLRGQKHVLEMVAAGAPLKSILDAITMLIENQSTGDLCSILRLDPETKRLHGAATGSLPAEYNAAIEGIQIGLNVGSCGTAAFTRERVVVTDIATDPRWAGFGDFALKHNLRACWSQPILSRDGRRVLGTVANYSTRAWSPRPQSLLLLETAAHLAQIAIEQAEAEEKLRRQSLAFDNLYDGIILTDARGRITDWNPAAERLFGYSRQEAVGADVSIIHGAGPSPLTDQIVSALDAQGRWCGEVNFVRKDGGEGVCETIVVPLKNADGHVVATVGVNHDVTERKQTEAHLRTEAAVTRILANSAHLADAIPRLLDAIGMSCGWETGSFWEVDPRDDVLRCAHVWAAPGFDGRAFEFTTRSMTFGRGVGLPGRVWETARPAWISDVRSDLNFPRRAAAAEAGLRGALSFPVLLDGRVIGVMEFFASRWRIPDERLDPMLAAISGQVGQFIERVRAEDALKTAKESAEKANAAKDRFLAMLSHELRTPLSPALLIAAAMASDESLPPEVRADALTIQKNIQLQTKLIDDLLDVSRIENGKLVLQPEPLDLHELVLDCLLICANDARTKGVRVSSELRATRHVLSADPNRLRQVLCNLLKNAVKFTPGGGAVSVRTTDAGDGRLRVSIADTGIGADAAVLGKMFEPYEQAGRAKESQGLGLGLTICKGLVEAHGGTIAASSEGVGRGLTITLEFDTVPDAELPEHLRRKPDARHADARHGAAYDASRESVGLRILLVDDHPDTLRAMSRLLQQFDHTVLTADCVGGALAVADANDFDVLISDVGLPDGTGITLMQELLKRRPVRGIALTGYGMESDVRQTREAGFCAHLTKPVDIQQLQQVLQRGAAS